MTSSTGAGEQNRHNDFLANMHKVGGVEIPHTDTLVRCSDLYRG